MKPEVRIEGWWFAYGSLFGHAYGHPNFPEGYFVKTSEVIESGQPEYKRGSKVETQKGIRE